MSQTDPHEHAVVLSHIPSNIEPFLTQRDALSVSPQGAAASFVAALNAYVRDPRNTLPLITVSLDASLLDDDPAAYKGRRPRMAIIQTLRERLAAKPYIAASYLQNTSPLSSYALPEAPYLVAVRVAKDAIQGDRAKVFVHSTGSDSPRPLSLKRNDKGLWKVTEWSSLEVGIRPPASASRGSDDL
ncbi:MAG: hypothetical protein Q8Q09_27455 [Deltaproteobacteria bacterium]|nr:hypothetical protein [Deltaproteobacteria bacterium]